MGNGGRGMRLLFFAAAGIAVLASGGFAQSSAMSSEGTDTAAFEVATIKPSNPEARGSSFWINDSGIELTKMPVTSLLQFAYNLSSGSKDQIIGAPEWMGSSRFDITAKEDPQLAARLKGLPREEREATLRQMVQSLLAERFQLKVHHETRDLRVLALTVAKGGPKLTETKPGSDAKWGTGLRGSRTGNVEKMEGHGAPIKLLVNNLSSKPEIGGRLVVDGTGLSGKYDFELTWSPQTLGSPAGDETGGPSLFAALQEQLGLKVEDRKSPVDCIVIDHIEMPSQN